MHRISTTALVLCATACGGTTLEQDASADDGGIPSAGQDAGAGSAGTEDAGPMAPGIHVPLTPAEPLEAPPRQWTWVDIEGARCANGAPTGIGVNLVPESPDVLIFLQGGGACWDGASCWGPVQTAFYAVTGYGRIEFATDVLRPAMLPLRRDDPFNPFKDVNILYVPYCTGDVHSGDAVQTYNYLGGDHVTYHVGARNLDLILARAKATFTQAHKVWLAGDSAGGFGSALNLERTQKVFEHARVDVLDDSGQPVPPDPARWAQWTAAWNLQMPPDCSDCSDVQTLISYYQRRYPNNRFGLISYTNDSVITTFMGLLPTTFLDELLAMAAWFDSHWPNGAYYLLPGILHVGLATPTPGLIHWVTQFVTDDPEWRSHGALDP